MKKIWIAISTLVSSMGFAAEDIDSRVTELENQMQCVRTETSMGTYGARTATARPDVGGKGWFILADVLYWHAKVGGTEYAYSDQDPTASLPIKGRTKSIDFKWDWGLRFGLGYNFDFDSWDVRAQYTWFDSSGSDSSRAGQSSSLVPLRGSATITVPGAAPNANTPPIFLFCSSAKSQYNFDYQGVDVELGRAYFLSAWFSMRPFYGVKAAWFDQKQTTRYTGSGSVLDNDGLPVVLGLEGSTVHVKDSCDFSGAGPRVGVDTQWHLGSGWSIFGNGAVALLYGFFDVKHREKWSQNERSNITLNANRNAFSPTLQLQLGLHYDTYLHQDKHHIGIGLGFEVQYWWRQNQMLKVDDAQVFKYERYSEDINMYGLTLDIKWDF